MTFRAIVAILGGWRAALFAVLAVAAVVACLFLGWRGAADRLRADAAEQRAEALAGQVKALKAAEARADVADKATHVALSNMDKAAAETNERLARLEGRIRDRPPVPAVCPDPDADLLRESQAGADRFRAASGELRRLRGPEGAGAK